MPKVKCPTCQKQGHWLSGAHGPFCSERCKLVDLGKWLGEEHRLSEPLRPEHFQGYEELTSGEHLDSPES
ncbi:MAG: DNA gyrase inhibitor YacG [Verrucomicrobia bacterium]|nr:DNA gyrase inhibitor YacG [Verrucomicrobiota bacterium]